MKELDAKSLKDEIKSGKPVAIFFYMIGCPHCDDMKSKWDDLEKEVGGTTFCKIESAKVPKEMGITGFPHFEVHGKLPGAIFFHTGWVDASHISAVGFI